VPDIWPESLIKALDNRDHSRRANHIQMAAAAHIANYDS
jgi:hypothetical protein